MKKFDLGDILSITTGRLVSPNGMEGIYKILDYMEETEHSTLSLGLAAERCVPILLQKYPQLSKENLKEDIKKMDDLISPLKSSQDKSKAIDLWLNDMKQKFGENLEVPKAKAITVEKEFKDVLDTINKFRDNKNTNTIKKNNL